ncbi:NAD-dependent protein deacylase [Paramyrothecium foliicola]|nr:NAD-dependent protein deacylase [Paramyrothecium foliicola]
MGTQDYKFEGWLGHDVDSANGQMKWGEFDPKPWEETDVDIRVTHSGICGTDVHTLRSGWGPAPYPLCVGHEIVGTAVRVGSQAEGGIKVGDRVGVGAQNDACLGRQGPCDECSRGLENYCPKFVHTYGDPHFNGGKSMGGYGLYHRAPSHFVFQIPDGLASEHAAPMLCGGITMYAPLKHNGCGPGKTVGILGVGGLGHFGIMFARALGASRVVGISRSEGKRADVMKLGADDYIATATDRDWSTKNARSFDIIMSTVSSSKMPLTDYLLLLKLDGALVQVGLPDDGHLALNPRPLLDLRAKLTSAKIGSPAEIREMMELAVKETMQPWVEVLPMSEANKAIVDAEEGKARYRFVLKNECPASPSSSLELSSPFSTFTFRLRQIPSRAMAPHNDVEAFHEALRGSRRILALCGAGLSASSGLPTFRGAGGYWRNYDATALATMDAFRSDPGLVWLFYGYRRHMSLRAEPNAAHYALAALARKKHDDFLCLTQNVDNLSQRAEHPPEYLRRLHGSLFDIKCSNSSCDWIQHENYDDPFCPALAPASVDVPPGEKLALLDPLHPIERIPEEELPSCPKCNIGLQRPGVVWFGESLDKDMLTSIDQWTSKGKVDLMFVIGTSANVYPAAGYIPLAKSRGARIVVVNPEAEDESELHKIKPGDFAFGQDAAEYLPILLKPIIGERQEDGSFKKEN